MPRNVCTSCIYHENFILLRDALHQFDKIFPLYDTDFTKKIVCLEPTENWWFNKFDACKKGQGFSTKFPFPVKDQSLDSEFSDSSNNNESNPENEGDDTDKIWRKPRKWENGTNGKTWLLIKKRL